MTHKDHKEREISYKVLEDACPGARKFIESELSHQLTKIQEMVEEAKFTGKPYPIVDNIEKVHNETCDYLLTKLNTLKTN